MTAQNSQLKIVPVVVEDIPEILAISKEHTTKISELAGFDVDKATESLFFNITDHGGYKVVDDGKIVAVLVLTELDHWWTRTPSLCNLYLFVAEDYRLSGLAETLVELGAAEAERAGLSFVLDVVKMLPSGLISKTYKIN